MGAFILVFINTTEVITTQVQTMIKHLQSSEHDRVVLFVGSEGANTTWVLLDFQYKYDQRFICEEGIYFLHSLRYAFIRVHLVSPFKKKIEQQGYDKVVCHNFEMFLFIQIVWYKDVSKIHGKEKLPYQMLHLQHRWSHQGCKICYILLK